MDWGAKMGARVGAGSACRGCAVLRRARGGAQIARLGGGGLLGAFCDGESVQHDTDVRGEP